MQSVQKKRDNKTEKKWEKNIELRKLGICKIHMETNACRSKIERKEEEKKKKDLLEQTFLGHNTAHTYTIHHLHSGSSNKPQKR